MEKLLKKLNVQKRDEEKETETEATSAKEEEEEEEEEEEDEAEEKEEEVKKEQQKGPRMTFHTSEVSWNRVQVLGSNDYLATTDLLQQRRLLVSPSSSLCNVQPERVFCDTSRRNFIAEFTQLLHADECAQILAASSLVQGQNMAEKLNDSTKSYSRVLVSEPALAALLWQRIESPLRALCEEKGFLIQPLGFGVTKLPWDFFRVNEAIRLNSYVANGHLSLHRDAQHCPSPAERSLFTLLIYLNDDYLGGHTRFYLPKLHTECVGGYTMKEELKKTGGLKEGYEEYNVFPKIGKAVIMSQQLLHEGMAVDEGVKYLLRTDIMVAMQTPHNHKRAQVLASTSSTSTSSCSDSSCSSSSSTSSCSPLCSTTGTATTTSSSNPSLATTTLSSLPTSSTLTSTTSATNASTTSPLMTSTAATTSNATTTSSIPSSTLSTITATDAAHSTTSPARIPSESKRPANKPLSAMDPREWKDFAQSVNFFREAQRCELEKSFSLANAFYECSLSLRYCYPMKLLSSSSSTATVNVSSSSSSSGQLVLPYLPDPVWCLVFDYMESVAQVTQMCTLHPELFSPICMWRLSLSRFYTSSENAGEEDWLKSRRNMKKAQGKKQQTENQTHKEEIGPIPCYVRKFGAMCMFQYPQQFFNDNRDACLRVCAMYTYYLVGHKRKGLYTVRFDPLTQTVSAVNLKSLLLCVFYNKPCYGAIYLVRAPDGQKRNPTRDFNNSVDRSYMLLRHNAQFVGRDMLARPRFVKFRPNDPPQDPVVDVKKYYQQKFCEWAPPQVFFRDKTQKRNGLDGSSSSSFVRIENSEGYVKEILTISQEKTAISHVARFASYSGYINDCLCTRGTQRNPAKREGSIQSMNHLIFDFEESCFEIFEMTSKDRCPLCQTGRSAFAVNIVPQLKGSGFHHAGEYEGCHCHYPPGLLQQEDFLDYFHLSHVHCDLTVPKNNFVRIETHYAGISAM